MRSGRESGVRGVAIATVAAFLPGRCAGCGRAAEPVCPACAAGLTRPPPLAAPAPLDGWTAAFAYEGVAREIVARVKYRNQRAALPWLAAAMVEALIDRYPPGAPAEQASGCRGIRVQRRAGSSEHATVTRSEHATVSTVLPDRYLDHGFSLVTWVPASGERRRGSGFDHGELLARAVGRRLGLPVVGLLTRAAGPPQTGRSRADRRPGPKLRASSARVEGRAVLLVDDVVTTGATLSSAASALRRAGARSVVALTAAATPRKGA